MPSMVAKCTITIPKTATKSGLPDNQQLVMLHYAKSNLLKKIAYIDEQIAIIAERMKNASDLNNQSV